MKKRHIALLIMIIILALLIAAAAYYYIRESEKYTDRFFHGTVINGLAAEGMTVDEVEDWIEAGADRNYTLQITFPDGSVESITPDDIAYRTPVRHMYFRDLGSLVEPNSTLKLYLGKKKDSMERSIAPKSHKSQLFTIEQ